MTRTIPNQIKLYMICRSHQLGLEVTRQEGSTTISVLAILHCIRNISFIFVRSFLTSVTDFLMYYLTFRLL